MGVLYKVLTSSLDDHSASHINTLLQLNSFSAAFIMHYDFKRKKTTLYGDVQFEFHSALFPFRHGYAGATVLTVIICKPLMNAVSYCFFEAISVYIDVTSLF